MRRLPGPAGCRLGERAQTLEAPFVLFRDWQRTPTQSSVRTLFGVLDRQWMSGSARCRNHQPRGTVAQRLILIIAARALASAPGNLVFSLDN